MTYMDDVVVPESGQKDSQLFSMETRQIFTRGPHLRAAAQFVCLVALKYGSAANP